MKTALHGYLMAIALCAFIGLVGPIVSIGTILLSILSEVWTFLPGLIVQWISDQLFYGDLTGVGGAGLSIVVFVVYFGVMLLPLYAYLKKRAKWLLILQLTLLVVHLALSFAGVWLVSQIG